MAKSIASLELFIYMPEGSPYVCYVVWEYSLAGRK